MRRTFIDLLKITTAYRNFEGVVLLQVYTEAIWSHYHLLCSDAEAVRSACASIASLLSSGCCKTAEGEKLSPQRQGNTAYSRTI